MGDRPVTIRTFDLGADKVSHLPNPEDERNPFLGLRSIRLALRNLPMFRTQLRAILRASALGNVQVMFPLVSTLLELRQTKMVLADVMEDLDEHGIEFNRNLAVGMMVEVPSAVMMIDNFVEEVDFISIGTNDLIQYTLAVDRSNKDVSALYNAADPSVLKLILTAVKAGHRKPIPVNLCGQMSGSPLYAMLLLGLGLRQLSVTPSAIPEIKKILHDHDAKFAEPESVLWAFENIDGHRQAKFKQQISEESKNKINELIEALESQEDVQKVYTNS